MTEPTPSDPTDVSAMFDLTGTTAVVTGGASGLGRAIAYGLSDAGATVVIADIDGEGARQTADDLSGESLAVETDVTDTADLEGLRDRADDEFGGYDTVFNIPGRNRRVPAFELTDEEWEDIIELNLTGVFKSAKVLGKPLVEQGHGSMINMASIRGIDGGPDQSAYSASKGGVIQLTKVLAAEWAPDVRVNALAPGYMKTELVREAMEDREWYEQMREKHMLERFGDPEEVVGGAVYLVSDASSFVTGSTLVIDGGWTAQ
jgi:NAD(P)-dependent dehydrogenase (short-subunit alcohol dehydrogenase family)